MTLLLRVLSLALISLTIVSSPVEGQDVSILARGAITLPVDDFGDRSDWSGGLGGTLFVKLVPPLSAYAGYQFETFECSGCEGTSFETDGLEAGLRLGVGWWRGIEQWIQVGVVYLRLDEEDGPFVAASDRDLGFQGAVGLDIPLTSEFSISPALRYQAWTAEWPSEGGASPEATDFEREVRSLALDLGLKLRVGH